MENFVRSAMAPETMVAEVAQNTVWNTRNPSIGRPLSMISAITSRLKKCGIPTKPPIPNINPKPINQNRREPNIKSTKFFIKMFAVFLVRVKPASTKANPGCIKNTSIAARSIHTVLIPVDNSETASAILVGATLSAGATAAEAIVSLTATVTSIAVTSCAHALTVKHENSNRILKAHSLNIYFLYVSIIFYLN